MKWILNNLNHIRKLKLRLYCVGLYRSNNDIWNSIVDANFVRQYCMPDIAIHLISFDFYIRSEYKLPMNNIEQIISSFITHPFFVDKQWTNVKCFFDTKMLHQHLSSMTYTPRLLFGPM